MRAPPALAAALALLLSGPASGLAQSAPAAGQAAEAPRAPSPIGDMAKATPAAGARLDAKQTETLDRVAAYFNSIQNLAGDFVQVGPDGRRTEGKFVIAKPGRVRFQYAAPSPLLVVADGSSVAVRDRKLATQDVWPLSQTPLRFLLQQKLDLARDTNVIAVYNEPQMVSVLLEEKSAVGGPSRLLLMFGGSDYQLKQWTVTDAQGAETSVAVSNLSTDVKPDPKLFTIDYQRILQ